jgi:transglutaminase-like putative cysteine protease
MRKIFLMALWTLALLLTACQDGDPTNTTGGSLLPAETGLSAAASLLDSREYQITERFLIKNHGPGSPSKHNLWVALIQDLPPYQDVLEMSISTQDFRTFEDENGNLIAEMDLSGLPPGESLEVEIRYKVRVNQLAYDLTECEGDLPGAYTGAELYIESNNPQVRSLAAELAAGASNPCEQARAFYDYVGENLVYTYNGRDWGAQAALGEMGADCSEYASLMAALARAAGIPARYLEGVLYLEPETAALARREHAWLEVYLPGIGWTPMDPTLGRSLGLREKYFAANSPDHIVVTRGRNPSALRGGSYYTHIYWPGPSAVIKIEDFGWEITPTEGAGPSP